MANIETDPISHEADGLLQATICPACIPAGKTSENPRKYG
jgi:hypothetical protein